MKKIFFTFLILSIFVVISGCGSRVPGNLNSTTYERYNELKKSDPKDL